MKPDPADWEQYRDELDAAPTGATEQDEEIQERVSEYEARKYMEMWTRIKTGFASERQRL